VIAIRTDREIALMREANQIVADVLVTLTDNVKPGVTTAELDAMGEELIRSRGGVPSFKGYRGYKHATCISIEEVVVHGIPGPREIRDGQIVSIDVGVVYKGYHGDAALTVACGKPDALRERLMKTGSLCLERAINEVRQGVYLQEVGRAVQRTAEAEGFSVVRVFVGHGIGTHMHEDPQIPNFVTGDRGPKLKKGMVLAIEPMINAGTHEVRLMPDGWTAVTADGKPSVHFEHSVVVRERDAEVLSATPKREWGGWPKKSVK
jgi:methionyl aminopeptidase